MPSKTIGLPLLSSQMCGGASTPISPAKVGHQSMCDIISVATVPGLIVPGHQAMAGTRKPPS